MLNPKIIWTVLEQQFRFNNNKSLFYDQGELLLSPSPQTLRWLLNDPSQVAQSLERMIAGGLLHSFAHDLAERAIHHFIQVNQFMQFTNDHKLQLAEWYKGQFVRMVTLLQNARMSEEVVSQFFQVHYQYLKSFLVQTNGMDLFQKYAANPNLFWVPCEQYSAYSQIAWLGLESEQLHQPVLDLGCGRQANLVRFLRDRNIDAYGMDRQVEEEVDRPYLKRLGWMEVSFEPEQWGTIISHLAFSNHFAHHHLKADGQPEAYAQKYMELLKALQPGGSFIYAPSVPFIEQFVLQNSQYNLTRSRLTPLQEMTCVTRLS